jgi:hypothetical protein
MFRSWSHSAEKLCSIRHKVRIQHVYCLETKHPRFEFANKISHEREVSVQFGLSGQVGDKVEGFVLIFELVLIPFNISRQKLQKLYTRAPLGLIASSVATS